LFDLATQKLPADALAWVDTVFHLAGKAHALSETRQDADEYFCINLCNFNILPLRGRMPEFSSIARLVLPLRVRTSCSSGIATRHRPLRLTKKKTPSAFPFWLKVGFRLTRALCVIFADMIARRIYRKIEAAIARDPAVALMEPRQAGKTTLALSIANALPSILILKTRAILPR